jgi:hypothetical protein
MFCFSTVKQGVVKVGMEFMSGLELGEHHELPSQDDHQLL